MRAGPIGEVIRSRRRVIGPTCSRRRPGLRGSSNSPRPMRPGLVGLAPNSIRPRRSASCRAPHGRRLRRRSFACRKPFRAVSARASNISPNCRPPTTCWSLPAPAIPLAGLGPQAREFLAAFSARRLRPDAELSWHRVSAARRWSRSLAAGRSVRAPAAGPARGQAAVSAEHRIGRRHRPGTRRPCTDCSN